VSILCMAGSSALPPPLSPASNNPGLLAMHNMLTHRQIGTFETLLPLCPQAAAWTAHAGRSGRDTPLMIAMQRRNRRALMSIIKNIIIHSPPHARTLAFADGKLERCIETYPAVVAQVLSDPACGLEDCGSQKTYLVAPECLKVSRSSSSFTISFDQNMACKFFNHYSPNNPFSFDPSSYDEAEQAHRKPKHALHRHKIGRSRTNFAGPKETRKDTAILPRLWHRYRPAADADDAVECNARRCRLPGVTSPLTLRTLINCGSLKIFSNQHIALPIAKLWDKRIRKFFLMHFFAFIVAHVLLFSLLMDNIGASDLVDDYTTIASSLGVGIFLDVAVALAAIIYLLREGWQATRAQSIWEHFADKWNILDALTHIGELLTVILHVCKRDEVRIK
jgi:hypothetical protein